MVSRISMRSRFIAVVLVALAAMFALLWAMSQDAKDSQEDTLHDWVVKANYVYLDPPRSGVLPGDIIDIPPPTAGSSASGPMRLYEQSQQVLGDPAEHGLFRDSNPYTEELSGSIETALRAGLLSPKQASDAKVAGARRFEMKLTNVVVSEVSTRDLEQALSRNAPLAEALRNDENLKVIYGVLRSEFEYRFVGSGETGLTASFKKLFGFEVEGGGKFTRDFTKRSETPMVIGYAVADLNLKRGQADTGERLEVRELSSTEARELQSDASAKLWPTGSTIRVAFLEGTPQQQKDFRAAFSEWLKDANLKVEYVAPPASDIRVAFKLQKGSWSYVGTEARRIAKNEPTINLGYDSPRTPIPQPYLHEIGHALGLVHEFQNPRANLAWNKPKVYAYFQQQYRWPKDVIDSMFLKPNSNYPGIRNFDPQSAMLWAIPADLFIDGRKVGPSAILSKSDRAYIASLYPT